VGAPAPARFRLPTVSELAARNDSEAQAEADLRGEAGASAADEGESDDELSDSQPDFGDDNDGATDGSHASDLGFFRQADIFEPFLKAALGR
jgi:hypothetical protein